MANYVDAHIHLEQYNEEQRAECLNAAHAAGVTNVVAVSMDLPSSIRTRELYHQYKEMVIPAYGFHPEQELLSEEEEDELIDWIRKQATQGEWFAIGEVGLPYYKGLESAELGEHFDKRPYERSLEKFIALAKELDRPVILHAVYEDADTALDLLQKHSVDRAHFHWFKGSQASIQRMVRQRYYISITPDVCYEQEIQQIVSDYPLQLLMVETDGPWPFEGEFQDKITESAMVVRVAEEIAKIKGLPLQRVVKQLYDNSKNFYS